MSTPEREALAERWRVAFLTECPRSRRATGVRKDRTNFSLDSFNDSGIGFVRYNFGVSPTPEPATLSLFAVGAMIAGRRARRGRRAAKNHW
jgi:hypothetical protein